MAKKKAVPAIEVLKEVLGRRVVSYHPIYAKAFSSVQAAIYLSQAQFWQFEAEHIENKTIDGEQFFDKTIAEWYEATGLSEEQQRGARGILAEHGVMLSKKSGSPARMYYRIDINALVTVLYRYKETGKSVVVDYRRKKPQVTRTSSGKFRPLVPVINGDINKEETNRDKIETREREENLASLDTPTPAPGAEKFETLEEEKHAANTQRPAAAADAAGAAALVNEWAREHDQTILSWYETARRKFTVSDFELLAIKFCGFYANHSDTGKRQRFLLDPVLFFRNQFVGWLATENRLAPANTPPPTGPPPSYSRIPKY